MAEVTAILGMANAGFKLSITLFSFAEAVRTVDKEILRTAKDISLFSSVLKILAVTLERGRQSNCISRNAFETSAQIVEECKSLFNELEDVVAKSTSAKKVVRMGQDDMEAKDAEKVIVPFAQRFLYLFRKCRMDTLRRNLESLKTSLQVMLSVLTFAEKIPEPKDGQNPANSIDPKLQASQLAQERLEMESLILANEAAVAEIRKHSKDEPDHDKAFKFWPSKDSRSDVSEIAPKPSITDSGIMGALLLQTPGQPAQKTKMPIHSASEKPDNPKLTLASDSIDCGAQALLPVSEVFPSLPPSIDQSQGRLAAATQDRADVINHLLALWCLVKVADQNEDTSATQKPMPGVPADDVVELFPSRSRPY